MSNWFSYCPFICSNVSNSETERQNDDANTPVIYNVKVEGKADD